MFLLQALNSTRAGLLDGKVETFSDSFAGKTLELRKLIIGQSVCRGSLFPDVPTWFVEEGLIMLHLTIILKDDSLLLISFFLPIRVSHSSTVWKDIQAYKDLFRLDSIMDQRNEERVQTSSVCQYFWSES